MKDELCPACRTSVDAVQWMTGLDEHGFAEYINRQESKIIVHRIESQYKWISVDDRLPTTYGYYLCFNTKDEYKGICKSSGFEICRYSTKDKKFLTNLSGWQHEFELTHWMPLPSPPTN